MQSIYPPQCSYWHRFQMQPQLLWSKTALKPPASSYLSRTKWQTEKASSSWRATYFPWGWAKNKTELNRKLVSWQDSSNNWLPTGLIQLSCIHMAPIHGIEVNPNDLIWIPIRDTNWSRLAGMLCLCCHLVVTSMQVVFTVYQLSSASMLIFLK